MTSTAPLGGRVLAAARPSADLPPGALQAACDRAAHALAQGAAPLNAILGAAEPLQRWVASRGPAAAACTTSDGKFGAVAACQATRSPLALAAAVHSTPHNLVVGRGAAALARLLRLEAEPAQAGPVGGARRAPVAFGLVATNGAAHAALACGLEPAGETGEVGHLPLIGCALYASDSGAVVALGPEGVLQGLPARRILDGGASSLTRGAPEAAVGVREGAEVSLGAPWARRTVDIPLGGHVPAGA